MGSQIFNCVDKGCFYVDSVKVTRKRVKSTESNLQSIPIHVLYIYNYSVAIKLSANYNITNHGPENY